MFKKFFKFLYGYVIIEIYGKGAERFVNICVRRGIEVWETVPIENGISLTLFRNDFFRIREIARKCRVRVRLKRKCGFKHMLKLYRRRYIFLAAIVLCVAACAVSTRFIWLVEINGVENSDINSIIQTLDKLGIKSGALKSRIPEGMEIKRAIINDTDNIAWAWMYLEGAKARVEIYEQTLPPEIIDKDIPCDIVAACDGSIQRMIVRNGEEAVQVGDAVNAGDVIVSGKVAAYREGSPEEYIYVHSIADVMAYTSHRKSGDYKLYYESRTPTGKRRKKRSIEIFGKMHTLPFKEVSYDNYDTSEKRTEITIPFFGYTGIAFDTVCYSEVTVNKEPLSMETALEFAKNDLEEKISKELTAGSILLDENTEYVKTDEETINVTLEMNFTQNIAVERPLSGNDENKGEEILDKQTDRSTTGG